MDRCPAITPPLPLLHAWHCHRAEWLRPGPLPAVRVDAVSPAPSLPAPDPIPFWAFLDRQNRLYPVAHPEQAPQASDPPPSHRISPPPALSPARTQPAPAPAPRTAPRTAPPEKAPVRITIAIAPIRAGAIDVFA